MKSRSILTISHKGLEISLAIKSIEDLRAHEETRPDLIEELKSRFKSDNAIKHPIIVDEATSIVIDGTHRVIASQEVGLKWIPACLVDYKNEAIKVDYWSRTLINLPMKDLLFKVFKESGLPSSGLKREEAEEALASGKADIAIYARDWCIGIGIGSAPLIDKFALLRKIEGILVDLGVLIDFKDPSDAKALLEKGMIDGFTIVPPLNKDTVINETLAGRLFPPKATRHIVPGRFLNLFAPLDVLRLEDYEEVNNRLAELVRGKSLRLLPSGSIIGRRRYEEEVYVFES